MKSIKEEAHLYGRAVVAPGWLRKLCINVGQIISLSEMLLLVLPATLSEDKEQSQEKRRSKDAGNSLLPPFNTKWPQDSSLGSL